MGWKQKAPIAGALGVVVIGGVAMTVPASAASVPVVDQVGQTIQYVTGDEDGDRFGRHHRRHHHGMRGTAVAEQLGIEVEVFRDAVKAVIQDRIDAGEERPKPAEMTPDERLEARAEWNADLAAELGISAAELEDAFAAVLADRLEEAVEAGKITQQEADEMTAAYEAGALFDLHRQQHLDRFGDRLDDMFENGVIDDTQYDALQDALEAEDFETLRELIREIREEHAFPGHGFRSRHGGFSGFNGPGGAPDAGSGSTGISI